jgi:hypothetical protein
MFSGNCLLMNVWTYLFAGHSNSYYYHDIISHHTYFCTPRKFNLWFLKFYYYLLFGHLF